jgi:hypothetical protein
MDDDWQDSLYDYVADEDPYEDIEEIDFDKDVDSGDEEEGRVEIIEEMYDEELDFRPGFKELQQMKADKGTRTVLAPMLGEKAQKAMRTPEEAAIDQIKGLLSANVYQSLGESKKRQIIDRIEQLQNIAMLNGEILIPSILWKVDKRTLDKKSFQAFVKTYEIADQITLLSYIRMLL